MSNIDPEHRSFLHIELTDWGDLYADRLPAQKAMMLLGPEYEVVIWQSLTKVK
jgi:hypothetical protein